MVELSRTVVWESSEDTVDSVRTDVVVEPSGTVVGEASEETVDSDCPDVVWELSEETADPD